MQRFFLLLLAVFGVSMFLRRVVTEARRAAAGNQGGARGGRDPRAAGGGPAAVEGRMVRDRVCNTFLPQAGAIVVRREGTDHFFCSPRCRDEFLGRGPDGAAAHASPGARRA